MSASLLHPSGEIDYAAVDREVEAQLAPWQYQGAAMVERRRPMVFSVIEALAKREQHDLRSSPAQRRVEAARDHLALLDYKSDINPFVREERREALLALSAAHADLDRESASLISEAA